MLVPLRPHGDGQAHHRAIPANEVGLPVGHLAAFDQRLRESSPSFGVEPEPCHGPVQQLLFALIPQHRDARARHDDQPVPGIHAVEDNLQRIDELPNVFRQAQPLRFPVHSEHPEAAVLAIRADPAAVLSIEESLAARRWLCRCASLGHTSRASEARSGAHSTPRSSTRETGGSFFNG